MSSLLKPLFRTSLNRLDRTLLGLLLLVVVAFGAVTLMRSAYLNYRHTDAGVYFRAAWAFQHRENIYLATDDNGWHYHYPPLLAALLVPLSDPPAIATEARGWAMPYPLAISIWYAAGIAAVFLGLHLLASTLECTARHPVFRNPASYSRLWWSLRTWPILICIEPVGASLGRGQITPFIFLLICAMVHDWAQQRRGRAGLWLAAAVSIKVFPAYLLLAPLALRDWRLLGWFAIGLFTGIFCIPSLIAGPSYTIELLVNYWDVLFSELLQGTAGIRTNELFNEAEGDLMSLKAILFRTYRGLTGYKPKTPPAIFAMLHVLLSAAMTLITLWAARIWQRRADAADGAILPLLVGTLSIAAIPMIPTAQAHYYILAVILVASVTFLQWERFARIEMSPSWIGLFVVSGLLFGIPELPGMDAMVRYGVPVYVGIMLWVCGVVELRRSRILTAEAAVPSPQPLAA